ncbi:MAG: helix-turn-helix transcriptional regulator [Steroidobacteraceae bacterium]
MFSSSRASPVRLLGEPIDARRLAVAGRHARIDLFLPNDATLCVISGGPIAGALARRMQIRSMSPENVAALAGYAKEATEANTFWDRSSPQVIEEALNDQIRAAMEASVVVASGTGARSRRASAVGCACRFIDSHLAKPVTLADLASHCGVGVRTLEYGFRQFYDTTPISFIKSQRLTRTHKALTQTSLQAAAVSRIARRMGFSHMGQYAQDYRALFGESPSMTLQRAPRRSNAKTGNDAVLRGIVS